MTFTHPFYELKIIQQPGSVIAWEPEGAGLIRRCVDPCLIVQLTHKPSAALVETATLIGWSQYVAHIRLISLDGLEDKTFFLEHYGNQMVCTPLQVLHGNLVSECRFLRNLTGDRGAFFIFEDLSVRRTGIYRFKVVVTKLESSESQPICSILSNPFESLPFNTIYEPRPSTPINKHFASQGVKIPVRNRIKSNQEN